MVDLKSHDEIMKMRESGAVLYEIMLETAGHIKPGVTTKHLDDIVMRLMDKHRVKPSFKGYRGYPAAICASVNDEIVHGIPGKRVLHEGDVISLDIGVLKNGYHSDMARTFPVGRIDANAQRAIDIAHDCFFAGIAKFRLGGRLYEISGAIERCARENGATVPRELIGHGVGRNLHEEPDVPNFKPLGNGIRLKKGLVIAIEPMINLGSAKVSFDANGWTTRTADGALSGHYENTVALTEEGPLILTAPREG